MEEKFSKEMDLFVRQGKKISRKVGKEKLNEPGKMQGGKHHQQICLGHRSSIGDRSKG